MEIKIDNLAKNVKEIINLKAKYQKVLLLYDNSVSNSDITNLFEEFKNICIFNKMDIANIDKKELFNGYKLLVFYCCGTNLFKYNFNKEEFVNVYCPTDNNLLPFFSNNFKVLSTDCYLCINNSFIDVITLGSIYFNTFINYVQNILNFKSSSYEPFFPQELTMNYIINTMLKHKDDLYFNDLEILKHCNLQYNNINLIHLIIIDALIVFFNAVKLNQLSLIDIYKDAKNNCALIEKTYALFFNHSIYNSIILNYNFLIKAAEKTKESLIQITSLSNNFSQEELNSVLIKLKDYFKNSNTFLFYLYMFDILNIAV